MFRFRDWKILTKILVMMVMLSWIPLLISLAIGIRNLMAISQSQMDNLVLQLVSNNVQKIVQQSTQFILQNHESLNDIAQSDLIGTTLSDLSMNPIPQPGGNAPLPDMGQPASAGDTGGELPPPPIAPGPGDQQQELPIPTSGSAGAVNAYLSDIVASSDGIEMLSIYDSRGITIASSMPGSIGLNHMFRPDVSTALSGTRYTERIHRGPNDLPGFFISAPVKNGDVIIGCVSTRLEADFIIKELTGNKGDGDGVSSIFIVDEYGIVLADSHPDSEWLFRSLLELDPEVAESIAKGYIVDSPCEEDDQTCWDAVLADYEILSVPAAQHLGETLQAAFQSGQEGSVRYCYPDSVDAPLDESCASGNWHTAAYRVMTDPYSSQPLFVIVADVSEVPYLEAVKQRTMFSLFGGLGAALLLVVSSVFVARSMAQPIHHLSGVAEEIEQDKPFEEAKLADLSSQADELGNLARVFSKMAVVIQERERKLKKQVMELQIKIDETKRKEEVEKLTDNEFFKDLQAKAKKMREITEETDEGNVAS